MNAPVSPPQIPAPVNVLADMREDTFANLGACCHYARIAQSFLKLGDDDGALYAFRMSHGYFEAAIKNFSPIRDIVDARRSKAEDAEYARP